MIDWLHWLMALNALAAGSLAFLLRLRLSLSEHIRRIRYEHGWTQAQFGERLGVDERTIRRWEQGQSPSARFTYRIAKLDETRQLLRQLKDSIC
jgi:DNA-binding XRE family transcriptional regulator